MEVEERYIGVDEKDVEKIVEMEVASIEETPVLGEILAGPSQSGEVAEAKMGKSKTSSDGELAKKQYPQHYRQQWEELDYCRDWLRAHPTDSLKAFCIACNRALHARKNDLKKHGECLKHKQNEIYLRQNGRPMTKKKPGNYHFHDSLLEEPELADWLSPVPGTPTRAWCRFCHCGLTPQIKPLKVHAQSRKHIGNQNNDPRSPPPTVDGDGDLLESFEMSFQEVEQTDEDLGNLSRSGPTPTKRPYGRPIKVERARSPLIESDFSGRVTYSIGLGNRKVGFLGAGQIAQAICQGILEQGLLLPRDVIVSAPSDRNMQQWKRWKTKTTDSNDEVVANADVIFLAVKSTVLGRLVKKLTPIEDDKPRLFISVIPGVTREKLSALLATKITSLKNKDEAEAQKDDAEDQKEEDEAPLAKRRAAAPPVNPNMHVVRCSPNKMMSISSGFCAYCIGDDAPHVMYLVVETMFSALGTCIRVDEGDMDAYSTMVASGAAFTCAFIEAMVQGGVNLDLHWDAALKVAASVVSGTSKMLLRTSSDPATLRKAIATPGGSTIVGLNVLQRGGLDEGVVNGLEASYQKTAASADKL